MITSLRLVDFKNFADETLRVGPFTVIVGANASGKSNIRDAFRFLHGIGRGYTLAETLGGRWGPGGQVQWQSVRGAPNEVDLARLAKRPAAVVINEALVNHRVNKEAQAAIQEYEVIACPVILHQRIDHQHAFTEGLTAGMRRVWVRGHENVRKRVLIQAAACNIGLLLRRLTGVGTPRSLQGRALSAICRLIGRLIDRWGRLTRAWGFKWTPTALVGSIAHRQAA